MEKVQEVYVSDVSSALLPISFMLQVMRHLNWGSLYTTRSCTIFRVSTCMARVIFFSTSSCLQNFILKQRGLQPTKPFIRYIEKIKKTLFENRNIFTVMTTWYLRDENLSFFFYTVCQCTYKNILFVSELKEINVCDKDPCCFSYMFFQSFLYTAATRTESHRYK
jgi:hypothetical protein